MKRTLVQLADELDKKGLKEEARLVDFILTKLAQNNCCSKKTTNQALQTDMKRKERTAEAKRVMVAMKTQEDKDKMSALNEKYMNNQGEFKGRAGEKFDNCVKMQIEKDSAGIYGFKLRVNKKHPTKEDAAKALCAAMKRKKYGCLTVDDLPVLKAYSKLYGSKYIVHINDLHESGIAHIAYEKGEEIPEATTSEALDTFFEKNPSWKENGKQAALDKWAEWGKKYKIKEELQDAGKRAISRRF